MGPFFVFTLLIGFSSLFGASFLVFFQRTQKIGNFIHSFIKIPILCCLDTEVSICANEAISSFSYPTVRTVEPLFRGWRDNAEYWTNFDEDF